MKTFLHVLLLGSAVFSVSCRQGISDKILIEGTVINIDQYGGLEPSFTPDALEKAGVAYGDLLTLSIGDDIVVSAPYVDAYTEAGSMSPCLCNYNRAGKMVTAAMSNGSFANHVGGKVGDSIVVRMQKKEGYLREYELLQGTYTYDRSEYSDDEVFANFRELKGTGLKPGVLFRSTSPINFKNNKIRYTYSSELCRVNGIKTIIDIADSDAKVAEYLSAAESEGSYMLEIQSKGNIVGLGSNADYIDTTFMRKAARAFREMISKPGPYLIHCNEGKDRTGFYCLLLEALCGASVEEIELDYMLTFENLYHQKKGTEQYELTWKKNGFRMLYQLANPQVWDHVILIDWDKVSIDGADLAEAAENYILMIGLSSAEIDALKNIISE